MYAELVALECLVFECAMKWLLSESILVWVPERVGPTGLPPSSDVRERCLFLCDVDLSFALDMPDSAKKEAKTSESDVTPEETPEKTPEKTPEPEQHEKEAVEPQEREEGEPGEPQEGEGKGFITM